MPQSKPYVKDVEFPSSFVLNQSPLNMSCAAAFGGFVPPAPAEAFRYCELGCSAGTTLNPLAAVNPQATFVGVDFNADHIKKARSAARTGSIDNVSYVEGSFVDLADHDLPQFDYISMNGTYSWLTPDVEAALIDFLGGHLRPGGLFYIDYMTMPGKAAITPVWRLMRALTADQRGDSAQRTREGLSLMNQLAANGAVYFQRNPMTVGVLQAVTEMAKNPGGLHHTAHDLLAEGWRPRYCDEVVEELAPAGLRFAGRAELMLNEIELAIPQALRSLLKSRKDTYHVEMLKDYVLDQLDRQDIFIKDAEPDPEGAADFLRSKVFVMATSTLAEIRRGFAQRSKGGFGFGGALFPALMAELGSPTCLADVEQASALEGFDADEILAAFKKLVASQQLVISARPVPEPAEDAGATARGVRVPLSVNRSMLKRALNRGSAPTLVSPVAGCSCLALRLTLPEAAVLEGLADAGPAKAASRAHKSLKGCRKQVMVRGSAAQADQVSTETLGAVLGDMQRTRLPLLQRYGIVESKPAG